MKIAMGNAVAIAVLASNPQAGRCGPISGLSLPENVPLSRPEIVRLELEKAYSRSGVKTVIVGNATGHYTLSCNFKAAGCMSPNPGSDYYVIKRQTRWRIPGATRDIDLAMLQDFTATYFNGENIGLVRVDFRGEPGALGMYTLGSWNKK
jgi:hypothetical protein